MLMASQNPQYMNAIRTFMRDYDQKYHDEEAQPEEHHAREENRSIHAVKLPTLKDVAP